MSYDEDEEVGGSFKMSDYGDGDDDLDEPLDIPLEDVEPGLEEEDPDSRYT